MELELHFPLKPLPCPRPKIAVRGGYPKAYYPTNYKEWKEKAAALVAEAAANLDGPIDAPVSVEELSMVTLRPKTTKLPFPKPDIDNLEKSVWDALVSGGLLKDDWLIYRVAEKVKRWTEEGEEEHILVRLSVKA